MKRTTGHMKALDKPENRTGDRTRIRDMRHAVSATPKFMLAEKRVVTNLRLRCSSRVPKTGRRHAIVPRGTRRAGEASVALAAAFQSTFIFSS